MKPKPKKLGEVLTGPETWVQGTEFDRLPGERTMFCLTGALDQLAVRHQRLDVLFGVVREFFPERLFRFADRALCDERTRAAASVESFNDHKATKWPEVAKVVEEYDRRVLLREGR